MTERLYYHQATLTEFEAEVVETLDWHGQPAVILNRSAFYPTSGGQPHDTGTLNTVAVMDVQVRESDGAVVHVLAAPLTERTVQAAIDRPRRVDHMQQHTGQHILSQAFVRVSDAETVGFHLGADSVTIDLNTSRLSADEFVTAEALANQVIWANHPVRAWFPTAEELSSLPIRKTPDVVGQLRVVDIGGFDVTACGGTHVAHTGELGLIKLLKQEKRSGGLVRIVFACGQRALNDYGRKHHTLNRAAALLSVGEDEVPEAVARWQTELKTLRRDLQQAQTSLLAAEAERLLAAAPDQNGRRIIRQVWPNRPLDELRKLAAHLNAQSQTLALLGSTGDKAQVVVACSADLQQDSRVALQAALAVLGPTARGGGSPTLAQGGGLPANQATLDQALHAAQQALSHG